MERDGRTYAIYFSLVLIAVQTKTPGTRQRARSVREQLKYIDNVQQAKTRV